MSNLVPVSTQWTLDAAGSTGRHAIESVYMIVCPKTSSKGTGWLLKNGQMITNEHVVRNCSVSDVFAISSFGVQHTFKNLVVDAGADLALLTPNDALKGGMDLDLGRPPDVGTTVTTWGFPLGYNGPAPLLCVGHLAGFSEHKTSSGTSKHLVVNGAFNPGNSGGPLFRANSDLVIGVVVSKHAPITQFHMMAIEALANNKSGVVFSGTDGNGKPVQFVESQLVADILTYFRNLTQVMIGEAISSSTVVDFLKKHGAA